MKSQGPPTLGPICGLISCAHRVAGLLHLGWTVLAAPQDSSISC